MCSGRRPTLTVDIGNDLDVVFGIEPFEVILNGLRIGMTLNSLRCYSACDAIARLSVRLTRRPVSRRLQIPPALKLNKGIATLIKLPVPSILLIDIPAINTVLTVASFSDLDNIPGCRVIAFRQFPLVRRSSISFVIHSSLPLLATAHWAILPMVDLVHPRAVWTCKVMAHSTLYAISVHA